MTEINVLTIAQPILPLIVLFLEILYPPILIPKILAQGSPKPSMIKLIITEISQLLN